MIGTQRLFWWKPRVATKLEVAERGAQVQLVEAQDLAEKLKRYRSENHFGWSIHQALRPSPLEERHP